jgi:hypothetical protein
MVALNNNTDGNLILQPGQKVLLVPFPENCGAGAWCARAHPCVLLTVVVVGGGTNLHHCQPGFACFGAPPTPALAHTFLGAGLPPACRRASEQAQHLQGLRGSGWRLPVHHCYHGAPLHVLGCLLA